MSELRNRGIQPNAEQVRSLRKSLGWKQEDLAEIVDCSTRTIRNAEKGNRIDSATLHSIAEAFGVDIAELVATEPVSDQLQARRIEIVKSWAKGYENSDVELTVKHHHSEIRLELPGAGELLGSEVFDGIAAVKNALQMAYDFFYLSKVHHEDFTAVGDLVFHRAETTFKSVDSNREFTTKFVNEFEFKDDKIIRRTTISDLTGHRRCLGTDTT